MCRLNDAGSKTKHVFETKLRPPVSISVRYDSKTEETGAKRRSQEISAAAIAPA
jgi:hypothetical protein